MSQDQNSGAGTIPANMTADEWIEAALSSISEDLSRGASEEKLQDTVVRYMTGVEEIDDKILRYFRRMALLQSADEPVLADD